ncbi:hypothetical protein [Fusibacter sp. 3D3]|uniref:hypothetical protein n=1 Tax=Fusibacter sp. 3D3 TaxID=1048380 RepID=UPI0008532060|nr:hypothetical protein [Fusibacter sp. 3D3]GAU78724.1 conserved protein [Fusibacter sp. 3D3]
MKYYMRGILTATIMVTLIFTAGCSKTDPSPAQTPVEVEKPQQAEPKQTEPKKEDTAPSTPADETPPAESKPTEPQSELYQYEITADSVSETGIYTIEYPIVTGLAGELTQDYINQSLKNAAMSMLLPDVNVKNPIVVTYEVKRQDKKYISVLYKGLLTWENGAIEIWNPITIDIPSSNLILVENLIKNDLKSRTEFNHIFSETALNVGFEFEAPQDWMGMYFTDTEIVFYFMENDFATNYTLIQIPFAQVMDYINIDFGQHPAS